MEWQAARIKARMSSESVYQRVGMSRGLAKLHILEHQFHFQNLFSLQTLVVVYLYPIILPFRQDSRTKRIVRLTKPNVCHNVIREGQRMSRWCGK